MKFSIKDFSSKCDQICSFLIENFIFCAVLAQIIYFFQRVLPLLR